jgi:hypothetical protein
MTLEVLVNSLRMRRVIVQGALNPLLGEVGIPLAPNLVNAEGTAKPHDDAHWDPGSPNHRVAAADAGVLGDVGMLGGAGAIALRGRGHAAFSLLSTAWMVPGFAGGIDARAPFRGGTVPAALLRLRRGWGSVRGWLGGGCRRGWTRRG